MNVPRFRYFVGDFETTVYKGQVNTEVWASASVEFGSEDVEIFHSIGEQWDYFVSLNCNIICYYHNLKFDGSFWLDYFLVYLGYKQAHDINLAKLPETNWETSGRFFSIKDMPNKSITYSISSLGQWYKITVKINNHIIEFRDSLKLLPFSVKKIGKSFGTKHKKLDMEYKGLRYAGCVITDDEKRYIANDVLVVKEALEIMFGEGHSKLTIGSCCLAEYKKSIGATYFSRLFPNLYDIEIDEKYGSKNAGEYIHKSYRGGWCYLVKGKEKQVKHNGTTADVNSLYPSMMSSESGNMYPCGRPTFWKGNYIPDEALEYDKYYFIRIKTRFYIYPNKLPFIQIKHSLHYKSTEMLEYSDVYDYSDGYYKEFYRDTDGIVKPAVVTMTLTQTDYKLLREHYELVDFEILDGCYFNAAIGIFDAYMEKYKQQKLNSKGARRELAKLFLNNLYGKMASSPQSNFKVAYVRDDKTIGFELVKANDKTPGFIAVGSAITSYARNFTIRAAQMNYYGVNQRGFIYADTDSIHCDLPPEKIKGIKVHDKNFCCWKLESQWDEAYFVRQKTYAEHIVVEDGVPVIELKDAQGKPRKPYYNIKCAGMPDNCKNLFLKSMGEIPIAEEDIYTEEEQKFLETKRSIKDFDIGLTVPGKLLPRRIRGGVLLVETTYQMR